MSTRRTTRATSKAASSRGASPAITESDIQATPSGRRSSRRAGSTTPLPAVASRSSTAYGTNTTVQPASLKVPESGEEINSALNSILQPQSHTLPVVHEEDTPSEVGREFNGCRVLVLANLLQTLVVDEVAVELLVLSVAAVLAEALLTTQSLIEALAMKAGSSERLILNHQLLPRLNLAVSLSHHLLRSDH